jgi:hypothetical protein
MKEIEKGCLKKRRLLIRFISFPRQRNCSELHDRMKHLKTLENNLFYHEIFCYELTFCEFDFFLINEMCEGVRLRGEWK